VRAEPSSVESSLREPPLPITWSSTLVRTARASVTSPCCRATRHRRWKRNRREAGGALEGAQEDHPYAISGKEPFYRRFGFRREVEAGSAKQFVPGGATLEEVRYVRRMEAPRSRGVAVPI